MILSKAARQIIAITYDLNPFMAVILVDQKATNNSSSNAIFASFERQGSTFPGAQGHMPLDFAVGP